MRVLGKQEERSTRLRDNRFLVGTECDALVNSTRPQRFPQWMRMGPRRKQSSKALI